MNGIDDDSMDGSDGPRPGEDGEDKDIKNLPPAKVPTTIPGSFLLEWWCCFMDIYWARAKGNASQAANAYVTQTQVGHVLRTLLVHISLTLILARYSNGTATNSS